MCVYEGNKRIKVDEGGKELGRSRGEVMNGDDGSSELWGFRVTWAPEVTWSSITQV